MLVGGTVEAVLQPELWGSGPEPPRHAGEPTALSVPGRKASSRFLLWGLLQLGPYVALPLPIPKGTPTPNFHTHRLLCPLSAGICYSP